MIAYVKGKLSLKTPQYVYVDIGGIAYHVEISVYTYEQLQHLEEVKLFTHLQVREDGHFLYGFYEERERDLFRALISVSGIGPGTAITILSSMNPEDIVLSIARENDERFKLVKGIGAKTAKRIILDLKDKIGKIGQAASGTDFGAIAGASVREEVISALKGLGVHRQKAEPLVDRLLREHPDISDLGELLKLALRQLN
jgi:holliday junction DNA helicase RuvA